MTDNKVIFVRSSKGDRSTGDSSSNDDMWDDTLLVKAYDNAIQLAQKNFLNKEQHVNSNVKSGENMKGKQRKWNVGDRCRCKYSVDSLYYEAEIIDIFDKNETCTVKYVGYENEEVIPLRKLRPSAGKTAIAVQCKQASEEKQKEEQSSTVENVSITNSIRKSQPDQKKSTGTKNKEHFKQTNGCSDSDCFPPFNFTIPQMGNSSIPPPPLPHIFSNLRDDNETEAMNAMLISWYMSGYHTGYYQGLKASKKH